MFKGMKTYLQEELRSIEEAGLYKRERIIITPQNADIKVGQGQEVVNFCANNYLGLSQTTSIRKTLSSTLLVSMLTAVSSNLFSVKKMPLSAMHLTTQVSLTACA